mgnify:CR=1 FL=1
MCAPRLAKPVPLQTNPGDTSSARKARRTVIKDEHRAKAAQRHEVYQERTNKQKNQLKTIKVMKRRNSNIASTLVLALVLMVGFPTSARPQIGKIKVGKFKSPDKIIPSIVKIPQIVKRMEKQGKIPNIAVPQPKVNSVASIHLLQLPEAPCPKPAKTAKPVKASPLLKVAPVPAPLAAKAAKEKKRKKTIETIISRFTSYAAINSQSWENNDPTKFPITFGQEDMAELIEEELRNIGADKDLIVSRSKYEYVYATIPANCEDVASIMFMAHMDCTPECDGGEITPIVHPTACWHHPQSRDAAGQAPGQLCGQDHHHE